jgi:lysyl-tRNA synthetase class II
MAGQVTAVAAGAVSSCNEKRRPARPELDAVYERAMTDTPNDPKPTAEPAKHGLPELIAERRAKRERLRAADPSVFPHAFPDVEPIAAVLSAYEQLQAGEETEEHHRVAGRIAARRGSGKAAFLDLVDRTGKIQLHARQDVLGEERYALLTSLDLGDLLGIDGSAMRSRHGASRTSRSSARRCVRHPTSTMVSRTSRRATATASWI